MHYDLHIHSCLSPCADDSMTPHNICNMAKIKGLDLIAVTDHNSMRQQKRVLEAAKQCGIRILYGVEMQSLEEVHCLAYFNSLKQVDGFQQWIDKHLPAVANDPDWFGHQIICDEDDEPEAYEQRLLLVSLDCDLSACVTAVHRLGGVVVAAHVMGRENSVMTQLGFLPQDLAFDGLEIRNEEERTEMIRLHPWLKDRDCLWLINSDAHQLIDISEAQYSLSGSAAERLGVQDA